MATTVEKSNYIYEVRTQNDEFYMNVSKNGNSVYNYQKTEHLSNFDAKKDAESLIPFFELIYNLQDMFKDVVKTSWGWLLKTKKHGTAFIPNECTMEVVNSIGIGKGIMVPDIHVTGSFKTINKISKNSLGETTSWLEYKFVKNGEKTNLKDIFIAKVDSIERK